MGWGANKGNSLSLRDIHSHALFPQGFAWLQWQITSSASIGIQRKTDFRKKYCVKINYNNLVLNQDNNFDLIT